ncbi:hypothetical protein [Streptomyces tailanensis]|uniref:hypothetical protein n=1 Tax=Streptomyces tailanensis TaxID=2569858 RepID=UPI00122E9FC5|nr:hypothetical protein [Streptomyces tailanensis]
MRTRNLSFGLYADEEGLAWVRGLVAEAVAARRARLVGDAVLRAFPDSGLTTADAYDYLADQWAWENPGQSSGTRESVELRVQLACSLRTWRAIRKTVINTLCPAGMGPHTCRVPWCVG